MGLGPIQRKPQYLFISGPNRSGKTTTARLLSAHSRMIVTSERFHNLAVPDCFHLLEPHLFGRDHFFYPSSTETHNWEWNIGGDYQNKLIEKYPYCTVLGDDVPDYFFYYSHLFEKFPGAKGLFLTRNVFDVAGSSNARLSDPMDVKWNVGIESMVGIWNDAHEFMIRHAKEWLERVCIVRYERLFSYDRAYLNRILDFIGIDQEDSAIHYMYRRMTEDWQYRFAEPRHLVEADYDIIKESAKPHLQRILLDQYGE